VPDAIIPVRLGSVLVAAWNELFAALAVRVCLAQPASALVDGLVVRGPGARGSSSYTVKRGDCFDVLLHHPCS